MILPPLVRPRPTGTATSSSKTTAACTTGRSQQSRVRRQMRRLIDRITKEFPTWSGGTLLFTGVSTDQHVVQVAHEVARHLAIETHQPVMLVDGDSERQLLSHELAGDSDVGLQQVLRQQTDLMDATLLTDIHNLRFLPCGKQERSDTSIVHETLKTVLADMRQLNRYVVVTSSNEAKQWLAMLSRNCDGTYLVVQIGAADQRETSELAHYLTRSGARLLGSVATGIA